MHQPQERKVTAEAQQALDRECEKEIIEPIRSMVKAISKEPLDCSGVKVLRLILEWSNLNYVATQINDEIILPDDKDMAVRIDQLQFVALVRAMYEAIPYYDKFGTEERCNITSSKNHLLSWAKGK